MKTMRKIGLLPLVALVGAFAGLSLGTPQALAQSALDKAIQERKGLEDRNKSLLQGVKPAAPTGQVESDVRRQKEDAAESLNRTLRDLDDRARTKALEGGKGIIIQ